MEVSIMTATTPILLDADFLCGIGTKRADLKMLLGEGEESKKLLALCDEVVIATMATPVSLDKVKERLCRAEISDDDPVSKVCDIVWDDLLRAARLLQYEDIRHRLSLEDMSNKQYILQEFSELPLLTPEKQLEYKEYLKGYFPYTVAFGRKHWNDAIEEELRDWLENMLSLLFEKILRTLFEQYRFPAVDNGDDYSPAANALRDRVVELYLEQHGYKVVYLSPEATEAFIRYAMPDLPSFMELSGYERLSTLRGYIAGLKQSMNANSSVARLNSRIFDWVQPWI